MVFAVNWDINNDPAWDAAAPEMVYDWGFRGVRGVIHDNDTWRDRLGQVKDAGLVFMGVYTGQSNGFVDPRCDWVQVHNEPNALDTPEWFVHEYTTVRSHFEALHGVGTHKWAFPGLHRGMGMDLPWLEEVFQRLGGGYTPDAIALHLYTHTPQSAENYCDITWNMFQVPIICTEWYRSARQGHHPFQCMLGGYGTDGLGARCGTWNSIFCLSDHMTFNTEGTKLGLLGLDDVPKDEFYSILSSPEYCRQ